MRIIAGEFRGRHLIGPPTSITRSITDRAKQSLFDALTVAIELRGAAMLDCFAGAGSMGLEALSRGAAHAVFVERDRGAREALRANIDRLGVQAWCEVLGLDAYKFPARRQAGETRRFRVAFIDPPYAHVENSRRRAHLAALIAAVARDMLEPGGLIIFRHPAAVIPDDWPPGATILRRFKYGSMGVAWFKSEISEKNKT